MKKLTVIFLSLCLLVVAIPAVSCGVYKGAKTSYDINCTLSNDYVLTGTETVTFSNETENCFSELKFNIYGNAFRKDAKYSPISKQHMANSYPNGLSYGSMQIGFVTDKSGKDLEYSICGADENVLSVTLPKEIYPAEAVTVNVGFSVNLANVIARTGYNDKTINLANFYPILCGTENGSFYECVYYSYGDPFFSECADYTVTLTCANDYVVASSGKVVNSKINDESRTDTFSIKNCRSFAFVLSKEFECVTETVNGTVVNYYYYNDAKPKDSLDYAVKSIKTFTEKFGSYIYDTYSVVQTKFVQGGMEFSGLVMISDAVEGNAYGEVIVHETAHQWWQTAVGNNEVKYAMLDEGLTEYSVVLFYEANPEYSYTRQSLISISEQTYKTFCTVYDKLFNNVNTTMLRGLGEYSSEYEYVNIVYVKPCIMFDYLRTTIGDEVFFKALRKYYKDYCYKVATPYDLVGVFEKTGANSNGFFESFFDGKVVI